MDERLAALLCPDPDIRPAQTLNREGWLTELSKEVLPLFAGFRIGPHRLTCGWPLSKGMARRQQTIGQCFAPRLSNGYHDIFVSPVLDEPVEVAGVVCHEIAHVAAGCKAGHKRPFVRVCRHVGLTKNPPKSAAPGKALQEKLARITEKLGPYPHSKIVGQVKPVRGKDSVTLACPACGCRVRMTTKWLSQAGHPSCGCGAGVLVEDT